MALTAEQRAARRNHIGSSDVPALFNLGFASMANQTDLYWSKVIELPDQDADSLSIGNMLEGLLCDWAAQRVGAEIERGPRAVSQGADGGIFAANFDAMVVGRREGVEAKYSGEPHLWGEEGTDQIPDRVVLQCQEQMYVGQLERVWVPVALVVAQRLQLRLYCVPRHEELIASIVSTGVDFWRQHVEPRIPPEPGSTAPIEALKALRREPQSTIEIAAEFAPLVDALDEAKLACKAAEEAKDAAYARVVSLLGEAEGGRLPDGRLITYLEQKSAPRCDSVHLRACHPEVYSQFFTQGTHRVLRIKSPKGA